MSINANLGYPFESDDDFYDVVEFEDDWTDLDDEEEEIEVVCIACRNIQFVEPDEIKATRCDDCGQVGRLMLFEHFAVSESGTKIDGEQSPAINQTTERNNNTMFINSQPKEFKPVVVTFDNESELHDVIAAIAAYTRKTTNVSGTGIASEFGLTAYSGNARKTANDVLDQLVSAIQ